MNELFTITQHSLLKLFSIISNYQINANHTLVVLLYRLTVPFNKSLNFPRYPRDNPLIDLVFKNNLHSPFSSMAL